MSLLDYLRLVRDVATAWLLVSLLIAVPVGIWLGRRREQQTTRPDQHAEPTTQPVPTVHAD